MRVKRFFLVSLIVLGAVGLFSISIAFADGAVPRETAPEAKEEKTEFIKTDSVVTAPEDTGGPDGFGYTYADSNEVDGPVYSFVEISGTNNIAFGDDTIHGPYDIGFDFPFYGQIYTSTWASSNGWLSIGLTSPGNSDSSNDCTIPSTTGNENLIAGIWDDLDQDVASPSGAGWHQSYTAGTCPYGGYAGACFIAQWDGMYHYLSSADDMTFEIILFDNGDILTQIADASGEAGSGSTTGIENSTGTDGLTYGSCNTGGHIEDNLAIMYTYPMPAPNFSSSSKSAPVLVTVDQPISYTLVLQNSGVLTASSFSMTDPIPDGTNYLTGTLSCVGGSGACSYTAGTDTVEWLGSIAIDEVVTVTFAVTPTTGGVIVNQATLTDTAMSNVVIIDASTTVVDLVVLQTDFEADDGGFVGGGEWEWGVPTYPVGIMAYSGVNVWGTDLDADATDGIGNHPLTQTITLPNADSLILTWWDWYADEAADERQILVNGTEVWNDNGGTDQQFWVEQSVDLTAYAGQTIELNFNLEVCCGEPGPDGWYIDDVSILGVAPQPISVLLEKTVGTDPASCATTDSITLPPRSTTDVYYCYDITNTGEITLSLHDLEDSELGTLLSGFALDLAPSASVFVTASAAITQSTVNTATWTAYNAGPTDVVSATDTAEVIVEDAVFDIDLNKTVGLDAGSCSSLISIGVLANTEVVYCYTVMNTGNYTLSLHDLEDSELGSLLSGLAFDLGPSASVFITESATIMTTTVNTATWTAYNAGPTDVVSATAVATVNVVAPDPLTVNGDPIDFEMGIPGDWQVVDIAGGSVVWTTSDTPECAIPNRTGGAGEAACVDSDEAGSIPYDTSLVSNMFDLTGFDAYVLQFDAYYRDLSTGSNDTFEVIIWQDGSPVETLLLWDEDHDGDDDVTGEPVSLPLTAYAGQANLQLSFRYQGDGFDWFVQVDEIQLIGQTGSAGIDITKTVGVDAETCSPDSEITVDTGDAVYYCLTIVNTGDITLTQHTLTDPMLGLIDVTFPFTLTPGMEVAVTNNVLTSVLGLPPVFGPVTVTAPVTNTMFFTASSGVFLASDASTAVVNVNYPMLYLPESSASSSQTSDVMVTQPFVVENLGEATLQWQLLETAVISAVEPSLQAPYGMTPVTVDGVADAGEWDDALTLDISVVGNPVTMSIKHADGMLYLFVVDTNNPEDDIEVGFYFDDENGESPLIFDRVWTNAPGTYPPNTGEGNFWLGNLAPSSDDQFRAWFSDVTAAVQPGGANIDVAYDDSLGYVVFEAAIPLNGDSSLVANVGDAFSYRAYVLDRGTSTFNGRFPAVSTFNDPSTYGYVTLMPAGDCDSLPWLTVDPVSGSVDSGMSGTVDLTFDSTGYGNGVYTGNLCMTSNDPDNLFVTIPVTMTVGDPDPAISVDVTLSTDGSCGTADTLTVAPDTEVTYCYTVSNTGNISLTQHVVSDTVTGELFDISYDLMPGASVSLTNTVTVDADVSNTITWLASNGALTAMAMDSVDITVEVVDYTIYLPFVVNLAP